MINIDSLTAGARRAGLVNLFEYSSLFKTFSTKTITNGVPGTTYEAAFLSDAGNLLGWCVTPSGDITANSAAIEAVGVQLAKNYCETEMAELLMDAAAKQGDYSSVEAAVIENQKYTYAKLVDRELIGGDKSGGSAPNKLNGLVNIIKTDGVKATVLAGDTLKQRVEKLIVALPTKAYEMGSDIVVLMSKANLATLKFQLMAAGTNFMPDTTNPDEFNYPGFSNIKIMAVEAIGDDVVATPANNVVILNNVVEEPNIQWVYDAASDKYISRVKGIIGIAVFDPKVTLYVGV